MNDDKIVTLHVVRVERAAESGYPLDGPIPVNLPEGIPQLEVGDLGFDDVNAAFNMRDWLQGACEAKGGKMIGGGFGMGQADIDIELEGCRFNISIRPLP